MSNEFESKHKRILFRIKCPDGEDYYFVWLDTGVEGFFEDRLRRFDYIFRHDMDRGNVSHMNIFEFLKCSTEQVDEEDLSTDVVRRTTYLVGRLENVGSFDEVYCTQLNGNSELAGVDDEGNLLMYRVEDGIEECASFDDEGNFR